MIHKCICNWITYSGFKYLLCFLFCIYHVIDITVRALQFGKVKKQRLWNGKCIPTSYLMYRRSKLPKVSGGKGFCWSRNCIFSKPCVGELSMFINAWLCKVTASSSSSARGGMSVNASHAASSNRKISDHQHLGKQSSQNLYNQHLVIIVSYYQNYCYKVHQKYTIVIRVINFRRGGLAQLLFQWWKKYSVRRQGFLAMDSIFW